MAAPPLLGSLQAQRKTSDPPGDSDAISIGFIVGANPDAIVNQWYPMIAYLQEELKRPVRIALRDSFEDMLAGFRDGSVDIPMAGPFNYVKTSGQADVKLIAGAKRPGRMELKSAIIVRKDSPYETVESLRGGTFAFTDIYSTAGYLMPRIMLADEGVEQPADFFERVVFAGHHTASLQAVLSGRVDAGALASYFVDESPLGNRLRTIWKSDLLPPEPIFARPGLPAETTRAVKDALLNMHERVPPDVMKRLNIERFVAVNDETYATIRKYAREVSGLPEIQYSVDYGRAPAALAREQENFARRGLIYVYAPPAALAILFIIALLILRKKTGRDIRLKFALSIIALTLIAAFAVSAISAAGLIRRVDNVSLRWQRLIGIFSSQISESPAGKPGTLLKPLTEGLSAQEGVLYVKVMRNGKYIADSTGEDVGHSVVQKIIAGMFRGGSPSMEGAINVFTNLAYEGKRFAIAQIRLDPKLMRQAVFSTATNNAIAVAAIIGLGFLLAFYWSKVVTRPMIALSKAVSQVRAGRRPEIAECASGDQIGDLVEGFKSMEAELSRTDELLRLKTNEMEKFREKLSKLEEFEIELDEARDEASGDAAEPPCSAAAVQYAIDKLVEVPSEEASQDIELREKIDLIEKDVPKLKELRSQTIIGQSPAFLRVIRDIVIRSRDSDPVLIYGESGAGKTGVARSIHLLGNRGERKFVEYNCAELASADPTIVLGKLFGYGRDSGIQGVPKEGQKGLLEECDGATLFLDEIALLPLSTQGAMLLPLEGRPFNVAAGKGAPRKVDVRFIFASNQRLEDEVRAGRFRNDLLRRIRARGLIEIPPLRERLEDVELLTTHFLELWKADKDVAMDLSPESHELLKKYDYRNFNVAELATAIKVAADNTHFRSGDMIMPNSFGDALGDVHRRQEEMVEDEIFDSEEAREIAVLRKHGFRIAPSEAELGFSSEARTLSNHLRGLSFKMLALAGWNTEEAASALAGNNAPRSAHQRIRRKMDLYLRNLEKLAREGSEKKVFNNLPGKYHKFVRQAVERSRSHGSTH